MVLSGLRGVGKTVLLNALRGQAVQRAWGTGKIEARPDQSLRLPIAQAVHAAVREVAHRHRDPDRVDAVAGVLKAFALRTRAQGPQGHPAGSAAEPTCPPPGAAPTPATSSSTWSSCSPTSPTWPATSASASRSSSTRCRTSPPAELAALCGACHEISQQGAPLVVVGAGLPHLPVALAASKSYAERLFRYVVVDRLPREMADRALLVPAGTEDVDYEPDALDELYGSPTATPTSCRPTARSPGTPRVGSPIRRGRRTEAAPEAEAELAVGFFGARYDRATPAERDYMRAMAELGADHDDGAVTTADIAKALGRKPQSLSPGPRRADQEGPGLLQRARLGGVHRAALRAVPARPARLTAPPNG